MKILIFGLPGSGKTTLAKPLAELIGGVHLNADNIREMYEGHDKKNWDSVTNNPYYGIVFDCFHKDRTL